MLMENVSNKPVGTLCVLKNWLTYLSEVSWCFFCSHPLFKHKLCCFAWSTSSGGFNPYATKLGQVDNLAQLELEKNGEDTYFFWNQQPSNQKGMCYEKNIDRYRRYIHILMFAGCWRIWSYVLNRCQRISSFKKVQTKHLFDGIAAKFMHKVGHESALEVSSVLKLLMLFLKDQQLQVFERKRMWQRSTEKKNSHDCFKETEVEDALIHEGSSFCWNPV